jgi:hypothetical protein
LGISPDELRGPRWRAPFRGVHTPAVAEPTAPGQRIRDAAELVPPDGAMGGWAAAYLLGAVELDGRGRSGRECEDVTIYVPGSCHLSRRPAIRFVRCTLDPADLTQVAEIPVTSAERTGFDLARRSTVEAGLVATDIFCRQLALDPAALRDYAGRHPRLRGVPVARQVLALTDPRSRSSGESRLRYVWVVEAGLPPPQCNPYVVDEDGSVVAMPDLLDVDSGLAGEYDGAGHRELAAHTLDNAREEELEALGLVVVRATALDVGPFRERTVARITSGRARASTQRGSWGWRPSPLRPTSGIEW